MTPSHNKTLAGNPYVVFGPDLIDLKAIFQFLDCMSEPYVIRGAAMPDMHVGYTMPIGGVIKTQEMVVPSWVGYDIGCGVCYVETTYNPVQVKAFARAIFDRVHDMVPTGFKHHDKPVARRLAFANVSPWFANNFRDRNGEHQLGTLGSGNHFIEIGVNVAGRVCIVIHSGSRGIGHDTASHYMKMANPNGKLSEGSYPLSIDSDLGKDYIDDMNYCLEFALRNRETMIHRIDEALIRLGLVGGIEWGSFINNTHNHAEVNTNDGTVIHRKGATKADLGILGVIPGNSKVGSWVVRGRGSSDALCSSSHGAGRAGSRKEAKDTLSLEDYQNDMGDIVANVGSATLDEAPRAYKESTLVMAAQKTLVTIEEHVTPLICVKGVTPKRKRKKSSWKTLPKSL